MIMKHIFNKRIKCIKHDAGVQRWAVTTFRSVTVLTQTLHVSQSLTVG